VQPARNAVINSAAQRWATQCALIAEPCVFLCAQSLPTQSVSSAEPFHVHHIIGRSSDRLTEQGGVRVPADLQSRGSVLRWYSERFVEFWSAGRGKLGAFRGANTFHPRKGKPAARRGRKTMGLRFTPSDTGRRSPGCRRDGVVRTPFIPGAIRYGQPGRDRSVALRKPDLLRAPRLLRSIQDRTNSPERREDRGLARRSAPKAPGLFNYRRRSLPGSWNWGGHRWFPDIRVGVESFDQVSNLVFHFFIGTNNQRIAARYCRNRNVGEDLLNGDREFGSRPGIF
jgi:hypothetical protein